jgi:hypothetical protein
VSGWHRRLIGGTVAAARNIISGNGGNSGLGNISLRSVSSTTIRNYIGTDITGNIAE